MSGRPWAGAGPPLITALGSAHPPASSQTELWERFFFGHFAGSRTARSAFAAAGVRRRAAVVSPLEEDLSAASTGERMTRYAREAPRLGKEAVSSALADAGIAAAELGLLAVVSCTGYVTPGIDVSLAADLGLAPEAQRILVGHVGCHAALPALELVRDFVAVRGKPAVLCCVELTSLHLQPAGRDAEQAVVHALFADAAVAAVVAPPPAGGFEVLDVAATTVPATSELMTWQVTDLGFRMHLSRRVPDVVAESLAPLVDGLLGAHRLGRADVAGWAVHPGGRRVLELAGERLGLTEEALAPSLGVLSDRGNCSSASVLLVLESILASRQIDGGDYVVMLAFGPGLSCYAALLRRSGMRHSGGR